MTGYQPGPSAFQDRCADVSRWAKGLWAQPARCRYDPETPCGSASIDRGRCVMMRLSNAVRPVVNVLALGVLATAALAGRSGHPTSAPTQAGPIVGDDC